MRTPLNDIEFLARSDHRVTVLETLTREGLTPNELQEATGIPRATIGRILGNFEERGWVKRSGRVYMGTSFGELLCEEFTGLLDTVETIQRIEEVARWLPIEDLDIDLRAFRDATVTTPEPGDTFRHVLRMEEQFYGADHARILLNTVGPASPGERQVRSEDFRASDRRVESITTADAMDQALADPEVRRLIREAIELDRVEAYRYEASIPYLLMVADGVAMLAPVDANGIPTALIETENETIRSWVEAKLDEYREQSTEVTAEDLPP